MKEKFFCWMYDDEIKPCDLVRLAKIVKKEINPFQMEMDGIYLIRVGSERIRHELGQIRALSMFVLPEEGDEILPLNRNEMHLSFHKGFNVLGTIFMSENDYEYYESSFW
ncbi:MAG: hypothetical protein WC472_01430 [Candidatus Paceibacterota bacterium]